MWSYNTGGHKIIMAYNGGPYNKGLNPEIKSENQKYLTQKGKDKISPKKVEITENIRNDLVGMN